MQSWSRRFWIWGIVIAICLVWRGGVAPLHAATRYLSPTGANGNSGTSTGSPWQTFNYAIPRLSPGDTLFLLDGTYTTANSGLPYIDCTSNAANGTASAPITIKALNERQAHLQGSGNNVFQIWRCAYWTVEGIYASNIDVAVSGYEGTPFVFELSDHLIIRRNLSYGANAWFNSHGMALYNTNNSLVEENEVYYVSRHGIVQGWDQNGVNPTGNVIRRNYVNGRGHDSMPGGFTCTGSCENQTGDEGISCYPCMNALFENNIVEDFYTGMSVQAKEDAFNLRYLGNILLSHAGVAGYGSFGIAARSEVHPDNARQMPTDVYMENNLIVNGTYAGCNACKRLTWKNMTILNSTEGFIAYRPPSPESGDGHTSVTGTNLLVANNTQAGFAINGQESQSLDYIIAYNNAGGTGLPGSATHVLTQNPGLGNCKVFIPANSVAHGAGLNGADIGANILYRYQDGTLTTTPLWDPITSRFPCGVQVAGINDVVGSSCFDVHTRLNVNTNGCTLPTSTATALPAPSNLRVQ